MSTNDQQRKIPTPADLDPNRAAQMRAAAVENMNQAIAEQARIPAAHVPTPADVAPAIAPAEFVRPSGVELSEEQRIRVEARHTARRVLGNPYVKDGNMPVGWAWQAIELASCIVIGDADGDAEDTDEKAAPGQAVPGFLDLNKPLPANLPPHVHAALQKMQQALRPSDEDRAKRARDYGEGYLDKPDGLKELNAQGYFPVEGSEPPRSEPLHDVHCHRWTFNSDTGRWTREVRPSDVTGTPSVLSAAWGQVLAEFGSFHVCI